MTPPMAKLNMLYIRIRLDVSNMLLRSVCGDFARNTVLIISVAIMGRDKIPSHEKAPAMPIILYSSFPLRGEVFPFGFEFFRL